MVAQSAKSPVKPLKRRLGQRGPEIPVYTRAKARNLYLQQGLPWRAISEATGLPVRSLEQLASREGWTAIKREQKARLLADSDARVAEMQTEVAESIASLSEQHALRGLERVGEALEQHGEFAARDFQSFTGGVRNLVTIMRELRAPKAGDVATNAGLNVFIVRVGDAAKPKPETNVTPSGSGSGLAVSVTATPIQAQNAG